jgi:hypothetical protein
MKSLINILLCVATVALVVSCGSIQNYIKKRDRQLFDSLYNNKVDASERANSNRNTDSTGVSNVQKEIIIEYFQDNLNTGESFNPSPIRIGGDEITIPRTKNLKRLTIREKNSDSVKLKTNLKIENDARLKSQEYGAVKKEQKSASLEKTIEQKPKWPYTLIAIIILLTLAYLGYKYPNLLKF